MELISSLDYKELDYRCKVLYNVFNIGISIKPYYDTNGLLQRNLFDVRIYSDGFTNCIYSSVINDTKENYIIIYRDAINWAINYLEENGNS